MTIRLSTKLAKYMLGSSDASAHDVSLRKLLKSGRIEIFEGTQPSSANTAPSTAPLVQIAASAGSSRQGRTGVTFALGASLNILGKSSGETWSGAGTNDAGTSGKVAGWFRFYHSGFSVGGASTGANSVCFDGSIATSGADLNMSNTTIVKNATTTLDTFTVTLPLT